MHWRHRWWQGVGAHLGRCPGDGAIRIDQLFTHCTGADEPARRGQVDERIVAAVVVRVFVRVGAKSQPHNIYDLRLVLSLMGEAEEPDRGSMVDLRHASQLLRAGLSRLEGSMEDERLLQRLAQVAASDRIEIKEAEWEIIKHLGRT